MASNLRQRQLRKAALICQKTPKQVIQVRVSRSWQESVYNMPGSPLGGRVRREVGKFFVARCLTP